MWAGVDYKIKLIYSKNNWRTELLEPVFNAAITENWLVQRSHHHKAGMTFPGASIPLLSTHLEPFGAISFYAWGCFYCLI